MIKEEIGKKLQELRVSRKYTQKQLSELLKIPNPSTIASWEIGKSSPSLSTFWELCNLYDIKCIYEVFPDIKHDGKPLSLSDKGLHIGRLYDKADERTRTMVDLALEPFDESKKGAHDAKNGEKVG